MPQAKNSEKQYLVFTAGICSLDSFVKEAKQLLDNSCGDSTRNHWIRLELASATMIIFAFLTKFVIDAAELG